MSDPQRQRSPGARRVASHRTNIARLAARVESLEDLLVEVVDRLRTVERVAVPDSVAAMLLMGSPPNRGPEN